MLLKQPKAVYLLSFVQLWNRFSHYGMRALLLLYMINMLKISDGAAICIFAIYCALVELGGLLGAYLAEKFLGLRRAVMLGGWLIGIGHLFLALELDLFTALGFVIVGSSLYTTNVATLLGEFYPLEDPKREEGFTLFYMSINIGAFAATLLCGYVAETYGWHLGFGLAAIGMVLANVSLLALRGCFKSRGEPPEAAKSPAMLVLTLGAALGASILSLHASQAATSMIPWITGGLLLLIFVRVRIKTLILSAVSLVAFFAAQEQISTSMLILADKCKSPAMALLSLNPLTIILGGPLAALLLARIKTPALRQMLPFALAATAFTCLYALPSETFLIGTVIAILSFAELLVGPSAYSVSSEAALQQKDPKIMAIMPLGFAMASSLGGAFSQSVAGAGFDISRYANGFGLIALGLLGIGILLSIFRKQQKTTIKESL
jgi:amino acid/peptide:H+ symporter